MKRHNEHRDAIMANSIPRNERKYSFDPLTSWPYRSLREMRWGLVGAIAFHAIVFAAPILAFYLARS